MSKETKKPGNGEENPAPEKEKKKKEPFVDDGSVIVDMDIEGMPWYGRPREKEESKKHHPDRPTFRERLAMILGVYRAYLPSFLLAVLVICLAFLVMYFWAKR